MQKIRSNGGRPIIRLINLALIDLMNSQLMLCLPALLFVFATVQSTASVSASSTIEFVALAGWPQQKAPRGLVECRYDSFHPLNHREPRLCPENMLATSIAGLAAQAVNEGKNDELVWIGDPGAEYKLWHDDLVKRLHLDDRSNFDPWQLLDRYRRSGIVKGYILYTYDPSEGKPTEIRANTDDSANVATSLAGLLSGVLISTELEPQAKAAGLPLLLDVRGKTPSWCFQKYRAQFSQHFALAQDPKLPQNRDMAIAQHMFVVWEREEPTPSVYQWLRPGSSIIGWNAGDEGKMVSQISAAGDVLFPSNWANNLCACAAAAQPDANNMTSVVNHSDTDAADASSRFEAFDPRTIDWKNPASANAFLLSDGDNVQWMMGHFCLSTDFWASPDKAKFPFAFGIPAMPLQQAAPSVLNYLVSSQSSQNNVVQASAGYFYPDLFGSNLPLDQRDALLSACARDLNESMRRSNVRTLIIYCMKLDSEAARHAYDVIARQLHGVVGVLAIQYSPYTAGDGEVLWTKDRDGAALPIVSAKFAIWADSKKPNTGTPEAVAALINAAANKATSAKPLLCWTIQHAWSKFDNDARGVAPSLLCSQQLNAKIRTVGIEELLWRIRMQRNSEATRVAIGKWNPND